MNQNTTRTRRTTRITATALAGVGALLLTACGGGSGGGEATAAADCSGSYDWRLAGVHPAEHPTTQGAQFFADTISERSEGRINVTVFPSSELGTEREQIEQVQLGGLDLAASNASPMAEFVAPFGALSLPYVFDDADHQWSFLDGADGQTLLDAGQDANLQGLAWYDAGARNFYSKTPVESPEDLSGLRIRVQESALFIGMVEAMGGSPTPMSFGEVYSALQTGVVDGAENNVPSYVSTGHYEVAPNYVLDGHSLVPDVLYMNAGVLQGLCEADQTLVREVAAESAEFQRETWASTEEEALQTIRDAGVTVTEVADKSAWQDAVAPLTEQYSEQYAEQLAAIDAAR